MNPILCFKRWSRKSYAIFASLHRVVKIGVVTFSCTLVQERYQPIVAQQSAGSRISEETSLDEVEVTASQPLSWTALPYAVSSITQKDIAAAPASGLEDLLEHLPGVDVRQRGPDGVQADISLNGGSFDQVLILLNGVNITDPQTGHFNLDIPIDLNQVKRVDVLRGSASGILGSNAFSGAINLITTQPDAKKGVSGNMELGTGSFHRFDAGTDVGYASNRWSLLGTGSYKTSNGYMANTDFRMGNGTFQAGYLHPSMGRFLFQMGFRKKEFGANSFYSLSYPQQFEATTTLYSALTWDKAVDKNYLQTQLYQRRHHDRFELFRDGINAASWYTGHNYHLSDVTGGKFTVTRSNDHHYGLMGVEFRNEHLVSNVLGEPMASTKHDPFDTAAEYSKFVNRSTLSGIIHQQVRFGNILTSLGATLNYTPGTGLYWQGGWDASCRINRNTHLTINANRSLRLPTFTDLYYQSATQRSNPALKPEKAVTIEGQLGWSNGPYRLTMNGFHRWGSGLIDWIRHPDSLKWESRNQTSIGTTGYTLEMGWHPSSGWLTALVGNYTFLSLDKSAGLFDSKYALDYLKHKAGIKATGKVLDNKHLGQLTIHFDAGYYHRSGTFSIPGVSGLTPYKPYWLADSRIKWSRRRMAVYLDVCNVFNTQYVDFGGLPQPGRNVRTGVSVSF